MGYKDDVADLLYCLYNEEDLTDSTKFWALLHARFSKEVGERVMTLGQRATQQAVQQAAQETQHKTLQETALRMLDEKCDIQFISRVTHLSSEEIKLLAKKKTN